MLNRFIAKYFLINKTQILFNWAKSKLQDPNIKEVLSKGGSFFIIRIIGLISGYGFTLFVSRVYGAEINGYVALSFSIFLIGSLLPRFGFDINLVKTFSSNTLEEAKNIYYRVLLLSSIVSFILCFVGIIFNGFFASLLNINESNYVIYGFLSLPLWTFTSINAGALRGLKKIKQFSFLTNAGRFIFAIVLVLFGYYVFEFKNNSSPIIAHTLGLFFLTLYSFYSVQKAIKHVGSKSFIKTSSYLKESYPLMFSLGLILLLSWTDTIFLGIYTSSSDVGIYNVAFTIAALVGFSLHSLNSILAPKIALFYKEDKMKEFNKLLNMAVKINFYTSILAIIFLVFFRTFILGLFGEEFIAGHYLLLILCVGQFSNALCGPVGVVFQMTGKQKIFQNLVFIAFIINLALNFALIKPYGYYGAAISSIVSMSFWNFAGAYLIWKNYKIILIYIPFLKRKNES